MPIPPDNPSLLFATIQDLLRHAPFSEMDPSHLEWMAGRLQLAYFPGETTLLDPSDGVPHWFYVIKQGGVEAGGAAKGSVIKLHGGECFPLGGLLSGRPVANHFRACEDTFCYLLPAVDFHALLERSPVFRDFCTRRLANLLDQSQKAVHSHYALRQKDHRRLEQSLASVCRRDAVSVVSGTPLREGLQIMQQERIGSLAVTDMDGKPMGILTLRDVLSRVALPRLTLDTPIEAAMTVDPVTLPLRATARDALLTMARKRIHHVLLVDNERLAGVISEKDLFALKRISVQSVLAEIAHAADVGALKQARREVVNLASNLLAQGMEADTLTELIATLNDHLTRRLIELECEKSDLPGVSWCWLALGSEGRMEQTPATGQHNAVIFASSPDGDRERTRQQLSAVSRRINEGLHACGFARCPGTVMAGNPEWCLTDEEWRYRFTQWMACTEPTTLQRVGIFFDFRPLHGSQQLATDLRTWLHRTIREHPPFLRAMAQDVLNREPPLDWAPPVATATETSPLDFRQYAVRPFVEAARVLALAQGEVATGTARRLRRIGAAQGLKDEEAEAWVQAFHFVQLLRLRHQHEQERNNLPPDNRIDPGALSTLDRRILKESFRQARKLLARLSEDVPA